MQSDNWQELWESRRVSELAQRVRDAAPENENDETLLHVMRARLASIGAMHIAHGIPAARALREQKHSEADALLCAQLRLAARAGAVPWAHNIFEQTFANNETTEVALLREQFSSERFTGVAREIWQLLGQVETGSVADLTSELSKVMQTEPSWLLPSHFTLLASLYQAAHDYDKAAETWRASLSKWPRADGHGVAALQLALCRWLAGDATRGHDTLKTLRDNEHADGRSRSIARRLVATLERDTPDTTPSWVRASYEIGFAMPGIDSGEAARRLALGFAGQPPGDPILECVDSFAALRHELEGAQLAVWRLTLTKDSLIAAIQSGAMVILGEERPLGAGFEIVRGLEQNWDIVELVDGGRPGTRLRWLAHQWDRSAFHGQSALLVLGTSDSAGQRDAVLREAGLEHDERFDLVDACDLDENGAKPHRARVEGLTEMAVERAPDVQKSWQRRGAALLALLKSGDLEDSNNGAFQRWFGDARERWDSVEWAHQLVAEALEDQGRHDEAGIAWSDAARLDPLDYRNYLGMARVRSATGLTAAAQHSIDRALVLEPSSAESWALAARLALSNEQLPAAELASEIALSLAPDDHSTHIVRALVHETTGQLPEATRCLTTAADLKPEALAPLARLCRRHIHAADWTDAQRIGERLLESNPGYSTSWTLSAQVAFATGDVSKAIEIARKGIEVIGPYQDIVNTLGMALSTLASADTHTAPLLPLLVANPDAPFLVSDALLEEGHFDAAYRIHDALIAQQPDAINPVWRRVQAMLLERARTGDMPANTISMLEQVCERASGFPYPRMLAGWLLADDEPEKALELLRGADAEQAPAEIWSALRHVYHSLGKTDEVRELDTRLQSLGSAATLSAARSLANFGLSAAADELIAASEFLEDDFQTWMSRAIICNERRNFEGVLEAVRKARSYDDDGSAGRIAARAAFMCREWTSAIEWCEQVCANLARQSGSSFEDPWTWRARLAVAQSAAGNTSATHELSEQAGHHPGVLRTLCHHTASITEEDRTTYQRRLASIAPAWHTDSQQGDDQ